MRPVHRPLHSNYHDYIKKELSLKDVDTSIFRFSDNNFMNYTLSPVTMTTLSPRLDEVGIWIISLEKLPGS